MSSPPSEIIHPSSDLDEDVLIKVDNVSKKFCRDFKKSLWYGLKDTAHDIFHPKHKSQDLELRPSEFWANQNISFEVRRGECLGLIGHNGAGKTTLLKMLNGLIKPDTGRIEMNGRIGALIALGAGFNPILTGRENIYVNGSILGLHKSEIDAKLDEIIDFAEVEDAIDAPVRTYSSGMQVRLGFAVAVILIEPDVLLIDEVLAVGDIRFKIKCLNALARILDRSAVIFVSHGMSEVAKACNAAMVLANGCVSVPPTHVESAIDEYNRMSVGSNRRLDPSNIKSSIRKFSLSGKKIEDCMILKWGQDWEISFETQFDNPIANLSAIIYINFIDGSHLISTRSPIIDRPVSSANFNVAMGPVNMAPGNYKVEIWLVTDFNTPLEATHEHKEIDGVIQVKSVEPEAHRSVAFMRQRGNWDITQQN